MQPDKQQTQKDEPGTDPGFPPSESETGIAEALTSASTTIVDAAEPKPTKTIGEQETAPTTIEPVC